MYFIIIMLLIFFDRMTKHFARNFLFPDKNISLIHGYLSFTYLENRGAAFGIFRNKRFLLVGVTAIVVALLIYYLFRNKSLNRFLKIGLMLIIAGAIGNLIDRVMFGYVIDFIHFHVRNIFDWPVFNVADICVVCGTIILAASLLFQKE